MKVRTGFVSNSSSASYIIKVLAPKEEIISLLICEYGWVYFHKEEFVKMVTKKIKDHERNDDEKIKYLSDLGQTFKETMAKQRKEYREKLQGYIDRNLSDDEVLFTTVLESKNIKCRQIDDNTVFESETSMHNDYNSGVANLLKEFLLLFMFEHEYKISCEIKQY